jgi:outer membrane protein assembly factor BamB
VAKVPGTPPTVYIGSENGTLFALRALNGKKRWSQDVGGPIPGTASVIGNTVFSSSFKTRESVGYDVHTHKRDFTLHSAGYSPVVSDGHRLYVAGYYTFYGLEEIPGTK